nr:hypothetical protein GCM10020185_36990 [Pseudomonas brassicacearum subsp. brassicacearum]
MARQWPTRFWRNVISSGATTGSTYLTFKDHKLIVAAQDDAGSFVASDGGIRGPYLEAAMQKVRADNPGLQATDMELANAILAKKTPSPRTDSRPIQNAARSSGIFLPGEHPKAVPTLVGASLLTPTSAVVLIRR